MRTQDRIRDVRFRFAPGDTSVGSAYAAIDGRDRTFVVRRYGWQILLSDTAGAYESDVQREIERALFFAVFREWAGVLQRLRTAPFRRGSRREPSPTSLCREEADYGGGTQPTTH